MSLSNIVGDARLTTEEFRLLMSTNNALLDAVIDIKQLLQKERQINYPGTSPTERKGTFYPGSVSIATFIRACQGRLIWTSDPEEHLELDRCSRTLKILWPSTSDDG